MRVNSLLVCSLVLCELDHSNSLLADASKYQLDKLQKVQNNAARLIFRSSRREHCTPLLKCLHWLPVHSRIQYKISSISFNTVTGAGPEYMSDILHIYRPSRQLRSSSDDRILHIPSIKTKSFGHRSLAYQGPSVWNQLPFTIRHSPSITAFKSALKTHLF